MTALILELLDKIAKGYIIYCHSDSVSSSIIKEEYIFLPNEFYKWYKLASVGDCTYYRLEKSKCKYINITITKLISYHNEYCMELEFDDCIVIIPDNKFNKETKFYCFQTFVDYKVFDGNSQLIDHGYKFLKNYDTRSKAFYYIDKFIFGFKKFYKEYFIIDKIEFNTVTKALELFHGDILYEQTLTFKNRDGNGVTTYTFMIVSVEKA